RQYPYEYEEASKTPVSLDKVKNVIINKDLISENDLNDLVKKLNNKGISYKLINSKELNTYRAGNKIGPVQAPGHEAFLETEAPYKPPITEHQIEESQSIARAAKETTLAR